MEKDIEIFLNIKQKIVNLRIKTSIDISNFSYQDKIVYNKFDYINKEINKCGYKLTPNSKPININNFNSGFDMFLHCAITNIEKLPQKQSISANCEHQLNKLINKSSGKLVKKFNVGCKWHAILESE